MTRIATGTAIATGIVTATIGAFFNNRHFRKGWMDEQRHKHRDHKWKSDDDRRAYEAGFLHGDRGEQWRDHDRDHDKDHR